MIKDIGYSDKMFYYNGSGENSTYNFRTNIWFKDTICEAKLKNALHYAIDLYPEFSYRPVICNGKMAYEKIDKDIVVFHTCDAPHYLGSDETNGYLFCFTVDHNRLTFSFFHGLSDYKGYKAFLETVLYFYAKECGADVQPTDISRAGKELASELLNPELMNPYLMYEDENAAPKNAYVSKGAYKLSENMTLLRTDRNKAYRIKLRVPELIKATKREGISFVPLLIYMISSSIKKEYKAFGVPVVAKVPADLRSVFNCSPIVNFSDSIVLDFTDDMLDLPLKDVCTDLKENIKTQLNPDNFARIMARKVKTISGYEESGLDIATIVDSLAGTTGKTARPVTYGFTYPGIVHMPPAYDSVIEYMDLDGFIPNDGLFMLAHSYKDELVITLYQKFESDKVAMAIVREFHDFGFTAECYDHGYSVGDKVVIDKLKSI